MANFQGSLHLYSSLVILYRFSRSYHFIKIMSAVIYINNSWRIFYSIQAAQSSLYIYSQTSFLKSVSLALIKFLICLNSLFCPVSAYLSRSASQ